MSKKKSVRGAVMFGATATPSRKLRRRERAKIASLAWEMRKKLHVACGLAADDEHAFHNLKIMTVLIEACDLARSCSGRIPPPVPKEETAMSQGSLIIGIELQMELLKRLATVADEGVSLTTDWARKYFLRIDWNVSVLCASVAKRVEAAARIAQER